MTRAPRERPILFSGEMVRAILDGRKTMTRRVMEHQPYSNTIGWRVKGDPSGDLLCYNDFLPPSATLLDVGRGRNRYTTSFEEQGDNWEGICPYGVPGDRLWCRETFCLETCREVGWYDPPHKDGRPLRVSEDDAWGRHWEQPHYRATDPPPELAYEDSNEPEVRWKPSIHMPRWASRLMLEVAEVRIERVQNISTTDIGAEGINLHNNRRGARAEFRDLWDSLNAKRGYGWDANPWVWVIGFRRLP